MITLIFILSTMIFRRRWAGLCLVMRELQYMSLATRDAKGFRQRNFTPGFEGLFSIGDGPPDVYSIRGCRGLASLFRAAMSIVAGLLLPHFIRLPRDR